MKVNIRIVVVFLNFEVIFRFVNFSSSLFFEIEYNRRSIRCGLSKKWGK